MKKLLILSIMFLVSCSNRAEKAIYTIFPSLDTIMICEELTNNNNCGVFLAKCTVYSRVGFQIASGLNVQCATNVIVEKLK